MTTNSLSQFRPWRLQPIEVQDGLECPTCGCPRVGKTLRQGSGGYEVEWAWCAENENHIYVLHSKKVQS